MRRVAERLGVAPMSLYTYVPGAAAGAAHEAAYDPEHAFEFGLRRVLDGVGVLIDSRA